MDARAPGDRACLALALELKGAGIDGGQEREGAAVAIVSGIGQRRFRFGLERVLKVCSAATSCRDRVGIRFKLLAVG
jgi:hypothetical protein